MTREDINRIATEYLNATESEFEMQDVIELADKALKLEKAIEDIKAEIKDTINKDPECGMRFNPYYKAYEECLQIINKYIEK